MFTNERLLNPHNQLMVACCLLGPLVLGHYPLRYPLGAPVPVRPLTFASLDQAEETNGRNDDLLNLLLAPRRRFQAIGNSWLEE